MHFSNPNPNPKKHNNSHAVLVLPNLIYVYF